MKLSEVLEERSNKLIEKVSIEKEINSIKKALIEKELYYKKTSDEIDFFNQKILQILAEEIYSNFDVKKILLSKFFIYIEKQISKRWIVFRESYKRYPLIMETYVFNHIIFNMIDKKISITESDIYTINFNEFKTNAINFFKEKEMEKHNFTINKEIFIKRMIHVAIYYNIDISYNEFRQFCFSKINENRFYELKKESELEYLLSLDQRMMLKETVEESLIKIKNNIEYFSKLNIYDSFINEFLNNDRMIRKTITVLSR